MKSALEILIRTFPIDSEAFRKFLTLVGEWWKETDGGTRPTGTPEVESDLDEDETNARFKSDLKRWGCPIRLLPAVRKFRIELGREDKLFTAFGTKRKEAGKLKFDVYSPNLHINRYIWKQAERMHAAMLANDAKTFWTIAKMLMRSKGYQICALNHVLKGWHRHYAYFFIKKVMKQVDRLARTWPTQADLKRTYIAKPSGGLRPLGVPSHPWRIYSHMWQNLITMWLLPWIPSAQHGFVPGRGVLTAWKEIMMKAIHQDFIWEYDLKNFFGEVKIEFIHQMLLAAGVPKPIAAELRKINRSITALQEVDLIPEPDRTLSYTSDLTRNPNLKNEIEVSDVLGARTTIRPQDYFGPVLPPKPWPPAEFRLSEAEYASFKALDISDEILRESFLIPEDIKRLDSLPVAPEVLEEFGEGWRVVSGGRIMIPQPDPLPVPEPIKNKEPDLVHVVMSIDEDDFIILVKGTLTRVEEVASDMDDEDDDLEIIDEPTPGRAANQYLKIKVPEGTLTIPPPPKRIRWKLTFEDRTMKDQWFNTYDQAKAWIDKTNADGEDLTMKEIWNTREESATFLSRHAEPAPTPPPETVIASVSGNIPPDMSAGKQDLIQGTSGWKEYGVPQGLATSPILSIFALACAHTCQDNHTVAYADDFIKYGRFIEEVRIGNPIVSPPEQIRWKYHPTTGEWTWRLLGTLPRDLDKFQGPSRPPGLMHGNYPMIGVTKCESTMQMANIFVNPDKSGPVKLGGAWLKPLRFLGMEYDGNLQKFRANTRRGATLEFDSLRSVQAYMHAKRDNPLDGLAFPSTSRPGSAATWGERVGMQTTFQNMGGQAIVKLLSDWGRMEDGPASLEVWRELPRDLRNLMSESSIRWPWERLFKSKAYGYFMSRMQSDNWLENIEQDFNYTFTEKSWSAIRGPKYCDHFKLFKVDIFNSSSFAPMCLLLDLTYKKPLVRKVFSDKPTVLSRKGPTQRKRRKGKS